MNAVEAGITVSGNAYDLNDEEAQSALDLELKTLATGIRYDSRAELGNRLADSEATR